MSSVQFAASELTARERRQLRNERRESKIGRSNWREEVEEKLLIKPKKRYASWTEELNLDNLSDDGPHWWAIRLSRVNSQEIADRLARGFVREHPEIDFKVYNPCVRVKRKLKNGTLSVKSKPFFPGCAFLYCILNKEIHDFVRDCDGIGGFLGSLVGNNKKQINRPRAVAEEEMEVIFRQTKEEQEKLDRAFEEAEQVHSNPLQLSSSSLAVGSSVRVLSGPFMEYTGRLKELKRKTGKATVAFMLFGKENLVQLKIDEISSVAD